VALDRVDRRIIAELSSDARLSVRALAERIHLSRNATHTRILHLIESGAIEGFRARVDRKAIGLHVMAVITAKLAAEAPLAEVMAALQALPHVESVLAVSGDIDLFVTVNAPDHDVLSEVILQEIRRVPGIASTRSYVVLDSREGTPPGLAAAGQTAHLTPFD
jgi:DNA-binding Lrp family transcriptional regulator